MTTTETTETTRPAHSITLPERHQRGASRAVVIGWIVCALGIGFALGRLLPASLFG